MKAAAAVKKNVDAEKKAAKPAAKKEEPKTEEVKEALKKFAENKLSDPKSKAAPAKAAPEKATEDDSEKKETETEPANGPQDVKPAVKKETESKAFDSKKFKTWGASNGDLPRGDCAALVTRDVDSRQWVMAKNLCTERHSVHVFAISKNDWANNVENKWGTGESFECVDLSGFDYKLCKVTLTPF